MKTRVLRSGIGLAFVLSSLAGAGAAADAQRRSTPKTHTVTMDATSYKPAELTVDAGDTVVWKNADIIPHTATSTDQKATSTDQKATSTDQKRFDSGTLAPGDSWRHTFKRGGDIPYMCVFHPTMKGLLKVRSK